MWILYLLVAWITIMIPIGVCLLLIKGAAVILYGSRVVFALVIALIANSMHPLLESGLLSYLAWAAMIGFGTYLLCCLMPRFNCSYHFLSLIIIPFFLTFLVVELLLSFILGFFNIEFGYTLWVDIVSRIACAAMGIYAAYRQFQVICIRGFCAKPVGREIDRALASLFYGLGAVFLVCATVNDFWSLPDFVGYIIMGVVAVGYFTFDCIVIGSSTYGSYARSRRSRHYSSGESYCDSSFHYDEDKPSLGERLLSGNIFGLSKSEFDDMIDRQL